MQTTLPTDLSSPLERLLRRCPRLAEATTVHRPGPWSCRVWEAEPTGEQNWAECSRYRGDWTRTRALRPAMASAWAGRPGRRS